MTENKSQSNEFFPGTIFFRLTANLVQLKLSLMIPIFYKNQIILFRV